MPTTRRMRRRHLRRSPDRGVIEQYVHGRITEKELLEELGNPFINITDRNHKWGHGQTAYEIWCRDGEALLARYNWQGKRKHPEYNFYDYGGLPRHLVQFVSDFGEPWNE